MSIVFDIVLVALFVFFVIRHAVLGLACSILNAGKFILSVILASLLCRPVAILMRGLGIPDAICGIVAFAFIFIAVLVISSIIIKLLSKIEIPIVTKIDKLLGLLLGIMLGGLSVCVISTALYSVLDLISFLSPQSEAMNIYEGSYVFKFVYDLKLFEFVRNLF